MSSKETVSIGLSAAIVAVEGDHPSVLVVVHDGSQDALPFGPFDPAHHRTLESGLRKWVGEQTHFDLGYTEQLYTFGDKGRHLPSPGSGGRVVSVLEGGYDLEGLKESVASHVTALMGG